MSINRYDYAVGYRTYKDNVASEALPHLLVTNGESSLVEEIEPTIFRGSLSNYYKTKSIVGNCRRLFIC